MAIADNQADRRLSLRERKRLRSKRKQTFRGAKGDDLRLSFTPQSQLTTGAH